MFSTDHEKGEFGRLPRSSLAKRPRLLPPRSDCGSAETKPMRRRVTARFRSSESDDACWCQRQRLIACCAANLSLRHREKKAARFARAAGKDFWAFNDTPHSPFRSATQRGGLRSEETAICFPPRGTRKIGRCITAAHALLTSFPMTPGPASGASSGPTADVLTWPICPGPRTRQPQSPSVGLPLETADASTGNYGGRRRPQRPARCVNPVWPVSGSGGRHD